MVRLAHNVVWSDSPDQKAGKRRIHDDNRPRCLGADPQNRYEIPEELIPADSRVEIDAKVGRDAHTMDAQS